MRFPPFSVLLRGTLCPFSQLSSEKIWQFRKLYLPLPTCRIRSNVEVRLPNVTRSQRHEVEFSYTELLRLFFVFLFSHNRYSSFYYKQIDKNDRFAEFGKIVSKSRFVLRWDNSPPFARNPHTSIFRFTQKTIKNEQTTANKILTIRD